MNIFEGHTYLQVIAYISIAVIFGMDVKNIGIIQKYFDFLFLVEHLVNNPAYTSSSDHPSFNVVDQRWNNLDPTLNIKQNPTSGFQLCTTLIQR